MFRAQVLFSSHILQFPFFWYSRFENVVYRDSLLLFSTAGASRHAWQAHQSETRDAVLSFLWKEQSAHKKREHWCAVRSLRQYRVNSVKKTGFSVALQPSHWYSGETECACLVYRRNIIGYSNTFSPATVVACECSCSSTCRNVECTGGNVFYRYCLHPWV